MASTNDTDADRLLAIDQQMIVDLPEANLGEITIRHHALVAEVRRRRDLCDAAEAMYDAYARVYVDPRFIHMHALFDAVRAYREAS